MRKQIEDFCSDIGKNRLLVQGAGGNVSWKQDDSIYVKASGTWLAEAASKDIFVKLTLADLWKKIDRNIFLITDSYKFSNQNKPSIETLMHVILPQKIVVHLHAVDVLSVLIRKDVDKDLKIFLTENPNSLLLNYFTPGADLARELCKFIKKREYDIVFLKNHGLVIGADTVDQVYKKLNKVLLYFKKFNSDEVKKNYPIPKLPNNISGYKLINNFGSQMICNNSKIFGSLDNIWAVYPDLVVFLGRKIQKISYKDFLNNNYDSLSRYFFIEKIGLLCNEKISNSELANLLCFIDLIVRQPFLDNIKTLNDKEIDTLIGMESEKFRINNSQ